jgi:hypothetical protein
MMMQRTQEKPERIDLGAASVETKGVALYDQDTDGGERNFIPGNLAG